jgi:hypothetical protein
LKLRPRALVAGAERRRAARAAARRGVRSLERARAQLGQRPRRRTNAAARLAVRCGGFRCSGRYRRGTAVSTSARRGGRIGGCRYGRQGRAVDGHRVWLCGPTRANRSRAPRTMALRRAGRQHSARDCAAGSSRRKAAALSERPRELKHDRSPTRAMPFAIRCPRPTARPSPVLARACGRPGRR